MKETNLPYILRLTAVKLPPIIVGLLVAALQITITIISFLIEDIPITWSNLYVSAYFTFTFGYVVFITRVIHNSHRSNFNTLLNDDSLNDEQRAAWKSKFTHFRNMWIETLIAIIVGGGIAYISLTNALNSRPELAIYHYWRGAQVILIWVLITQSTSLFMRNTTIMNKLSKDMKIDLINLDKLMPLTKAGITSTLAFIGAYTFLFIEGINISDFDNPALFVLIPSIIALIATPLKGIRKRIIHEKEAEIRLIDRAIDGDMEALKASRLQNNLANINVIDLISYKKTIETLIEIPLNIPTASRFIFYLIIPLLTWIAGSIVDKVIDYFII